MSDQNRRHPVATGPTLRRAGLALSWTCTCTVACADDAGIEQSAAAGDGSDGATQATTADDTPSETTNDGASAGESGASDASTASTSTTGASEDGDNDELPVTGGSQGEHDCDMTDIPDGDPGGLAWDITWSSEAGFDYVTVRVTDRGQILVLSDASNPDTGDRRSELLRLNADGTVADRRALGHNASMALVADPAGGFVVVGQAAVHDVEADAWAARWDDQGDLSWELTWDQPGGGPELALAAAFSPEGSIFVGGQLVSAEHLTDTDVWVARISASGQLEWMQRYNHAANWKDLLRALLVTEANEALALTLLPADAGGFDIAALLRFDAAGNELDGPIELDHEAARGVADVRQLPGGRLAFVGDGRFEGQPWGWLAVADERGEFRWLRHGIGPTDATNAHAMLVRVAADDDLLVASRHSGCPDDPDLGIDAMWISTFGIDGQSRWHRRWVHPRRWSVVPMDMELGADARVVIAAHAYDLTGTGQRELRVLAFETSRSLAGAQRAH